MDIQNQLKALSKKVVGLKDKIETEESTKHAFVLPFINALGFDTFNPTEVVPEFTADIGLKKGEKVDYAIFLDHKPILIIECKHWSNNLDNHNSQLIRYFHATKTRFALLTNGVQFKFFTDLEQPNKMDLKPFFEFDITRLKDQDFTEISKFHKSNFDVQKIVNTASSLKYTREIKKYIGRQLDEPSDKFVRFFAGQVYAGRFTEKVLLEFQDLVRKAFKQFINDQINDRLNAALDKEAATQQEDQLEELEEPSKINTTEEEMEGYRIVVAILRRKVDKSRIAFRDTQSYFGILLDDNNRKPICRLHFNGSKKYLGCIGTDKKETRHLIESLSEIYDYEDQILSAISIYEN